MGNGLSVGSFNQEIENRQKQNYCSRKVNVQEFVLVYVNEFPLSEHDKPEEDASCLEKAKFITPALF